MKTTSKSYLKLYGFLICLWFIAMGSIGSINELKAQGALTTLNESFEEEDALSAYTLLPEVSPAAIKRQTAGQNYGPGTVVSPTAKDDLGTYYAAFEAMMLNKDVKISMTTKEMDLSGFTKPELKFYGWFGDYQMVTPATGSATLTVEESADNTTFTAIGQGVNSSNSTEWEEFKYELKKESKYIRIVLTVNTSGFSPFFLDGLKIEEYTPPVYTEINEGFEGEPCISEYWTVVADATTTSVVWACNDGKTGYGGGSTGTPGAAKTGAKCISFLGAGTTTITTPALTMEGEAFVEFAYYITGNAMVTDLKVYSSTDGSSFSEVTNTITKDSWTDAKLALPEGTTHVRFTGINAGSGAPYGAFLDDIKIYSIVPEPVYSDIYLDFEGDPCIPVSWTAVADGATTSAVWACNNGSTGANGAPGAAQAGAKCIAFTLSAPASVKTTLTSPELTLSNEHQLEFYHYMNASGGSNPTSLKILSSTDGTAYTEIKSLTDKTSAWTKVKVDLTSDIKYIRFEGINSGQGAPAGVYLDEIKISKSAPESAVTTINESFEGGLIPETWIVNKDGGQYYGNMIVESKASVEGAKPTTTPAGGGEKILRYASNWATYEDNSILTTPLLDLSGYAEVSLSFWYWCVKPEGDSPYAYVKVSYTTNGTDWTTITDGENQYSVQTLTNSKWKKYVTTSVPNTATRVKFEFTNSGNQNLMFRADVYYDMFYIGEPVCESPSKLEVSEITKTDAVLTITAFDKEASYKVAYGTKAEFEEADYAPVTRVESAATTTYKLENLVGSTTYNVSVISVCSEDATSSAATVSFKTLDACAAPSNLVVSETTSSSCKLAWQENGEAVKWLVGYKEAAYDFDYTWSSAEKLEITSNPYTLNLNKPETSYVLAIKAVCGTNVGDTSNESNKASLKTLETCPSTGYPTASDITANGFTVDWTPTGEETKWELSISTIDKPNDTTNIMVEAHPYIYDNLNSASVYVVKVRSYCDADNQGKWRESGRITTGCVTITEESLPYSQSMEQSSVLYGLSPCMSSSININAYSLISVREGTETSKYRGAFARTGKSFMVATTGYGQNLLYADVFLPEMDLIAGHKYEFSFYATLAAYNESDLAGDVFKVSSIVGTDKENMQTIGEVKTFAATDKTYALYTVEYTPEASGKYFFGINLVADAENSDLILAIDDFKVSYNPDCQGVADIVASEVTHNSAKIDWTSAEVASYQIRYGESVSYQTSNTVVNVKENTFTINGLKAESAYKLQMRAACAANDTSAWSDEITFTTDLACHPPKSVVIAEKTANGFVVNFEKGRDEAKWQITCNKGITYKKGEADGEEVTSTSKTYTDLVGGSYYSLALRSVCEDAKSTWVEIRTTTSCVPVATPYTQDFEEILSTELPPCMVSVGTSEIKTNTEGEVTGTVKSHSGKGFVYAIMANSTLWLPSVMLEDESAYEISAWFQAVEVNSTIAIVRKDKDGKSVTIKEAKISKSLTYEQLTTRITTEEAGEYTFGIYMQSASAAIAADDFSITQRTIEPKNLRASEPTSNSVRLAWDMAANIDSVQIEYRKQGQETYSSVFAKDTVAVVKNLEAGTVYEWRIKAFSVFGLSDYVNGKNFTTIQTACATPTNLSVSDVTYSTANLSWKGEAASYEIRMRPAGTTDRYRTETSKEAKFAVEALLDSTKYEWAVRAICGESNASEWAEGSNFTTTKAPCGEPTGLNAELNKEEKKVELTWFGDASDYVVRYKLQSAADYTLLAVKTNICDLKDLANGKYDWAVRAICSEVDSSVWVAGKTIDVEWVYNEDLQAAGIKVWSSRNTISILSEAGVILDKVEVLDNTGRRVCSNIINSTEAEMDCGFANGNYLLRIYAASKVYTVKIGLIRR